MYYTFTNGKNINLVTSWDSSCGNPKDTWELKFTATVRQLDKNGFVFDADIISRILDSLRPAEGQGWKGSCEQLLGGFMREFLGLEENWKNLLTLEARMSVVGRSKVAEVSLSYGEIQNVDQWPARMEFGLLARPRKGGRQ